MVTLVLKHIVIFENYVPIKSKSDTEAGFALRRSFSKYVNQPSVLHIIYI